MGLDMYLRATIYTSDHFEKDLNSRLREMLDLGPLPEIGFITVSVEVGYWRKANAIHAWFVENVQGGDDNCQPHDVSREQLIELREICDRILALQDTNELAAIELARQILPTQQGFFFGTYEYDDWYFASLARTSTIINDLLANPNLTNYDFQYDSSW